MDASDKVIGLSPFFPRTSLPRLLWLSSLTVMLMYLPKNSPIALVAIGGVALAAFHPHNIAERG
jgi:hypothetical protein